MNNKKIEYNIVLTLYTHQNCSIIYIVKNHNNILYQQTFNYSTINDSNYIIRKNVMGHCANIINRFNVDTILMEQTKLFTDSFSKYPDPQIYKNVTLSYSIQVSVEDHFMDVVDNILVIPYTDWTQEVLNTRFKYIMDRCKEHILLDTNLTDEQLTKIQELNSYQALCFSECTNYDKLMNKKYLIR